MAKLLTYNFLGLHIYLVGKIKFKLLFQGPLAKWDQLKKVLFSRTWTFEVKSAQIIEYDCWNDFFLEVFACERPIFRSKDRYRGSIRDSGVFPTFLMYFFCCSGFEPVKACWKRPWTVLGGRANPCGRRWMRTSKSWRLCLLKLLDNTFTFSETNRLAPENQWLEAEISFRGELLVSGSVDR